MVEESVRVEKHTRRETRKKMACVGAARDRLDNEVTGSVGDDVEREREVVSDVVRPPKT